MMICLFISMGLSAQSRMASAETSYLYDLDHEFLIDYAVASQGDRYKIFLRFKLNSGMVKIGDYEISYDLRNSYIDEKRIDSSVKLDSSHVVDVGFREFTYAFEFQKSSDQSMAVVQISNIIKNKKYYRDITLSTKSSAVYQPFLLFQADKEVPLFNRYLNLDTSFRVKNVFGNANSFSIQGVENNAGVAMPPFDDGSPNANEAVSIDTVYGVKNNEAFTFSTPGFYEITADTDGSATLGVLVTDSFYPFFEDYREMVKPLVYISTNQEYNDMLGSDNSRKGFEQFVLNTLSNNTQVAQDFIKYYYRRIRKSAQLFTTTTEGWKTDRGMVYQIYGDPVQVFRNETTELWVYALETGGRARFIFDIVKGPAGTQEFKLIRGKKYRDGWMSAVSRWRSGRIIE